jgi:hypothetical protein
MRETPRHIMIAHILQFLFLASDSSDLALFLITKAVSLIELAFSSKSY